jgi:hypothetical protein
MPTPRATRTATATAGFTVLGVVYQNDEGAPVSESDVVTYAAATGVNYPILSDPNEVGRRFEVDNGIPSLTLLGPGPEVLIRDGYVSTGDIVDALP